MMPSLVAQLVVLLKDPSLGFIIGYAALLKSIQNNSQYFEPQYRVALVAVGATIYLVVNLSLPWLARWLERRTSRTSGPALDAEMMALQATGGGIHTGT